MGELKGDREVEEKHQGVTKRLEEAAAEIPASDHKPA